MANNVQDLIRRRQANAIDSSSMTNMTSRQRGRPKADPHRDLRGELLRISRTLLDEGGTSALNIREVARRAGCTHQAPYHYFEDRETILAALVVEGFDELTRRLQAANDLVETQGVRPTLIAAGQAYVHFALSQPGVFRVMFRPDACNPLRFPAVLEAGRRARNELVRLTQIAHGEQATSAQGSILWAHVHGLACLLIDGPLATAFETQEQRERHRDEVAKTFANMLLGLKAEPISNPGRDQDDRNN